MDLAHVKQLLGETSKRCLDLRDKLSDKGAPLTSEERQTIRFAAYPSVGESLNEIKSAFLTGDMKWIDHALEGVGNFVKSFMD